MNPKAVFGLFVAVAAVQLTVPAFQIWKHEDILRTGMPYKFRTAPVDPYDAFRGRYVALNYADTQAPVRRGDKLEYRQPAYVGLAVDDAGFARFTELSAMPPVGCDFVRVQYWYSVGQGSNSQFRLPFDKFFMEETKAPKAEQAYWRHGNRRGDTNDTYVVVRVKGGRGVIEDLYIKDTPIRNFLEQEAAKAQP
jgi:uncharacterized membrane-anchored protein